MESLVISMVYRNEFIEGSQNANLKGNAQISYVKDRYAMDFQIFRNLSKMQKKSGACVTTS
jgi:hypothetical protein